MKIGFVCTNYNNSAFTRMAVESLHGVDGGSTIPIVVVDNQSTPTDVEALTTLSRDFPQMALVRSSQNVGYFAGLNLGIRQLRSRMPDVDVVVIGNNDVTFPKDFVLCLDRHRDVFDRWAVVAPDIVTKAGVHQNPHVRNPISPIRQTVWDLYFFSYGLAATIKLAARATRRFTEREENSPDGEMYKTPGPIEQGYGACYLLGPMFFRHFEQLYAPTFLLHEEFFLFEQLKLINQLTYYDPRFVVQHHGHATTQRLPSRRQWDLGRTAHHVSRNLTAMEPAERRQVIERATAHRP